MSRPALRSNQPSCSMGNSTTTQFYMEVMLWICVREVPEINLVQDTEGNFMKECSVKILSETPAILTEVFRGFPQSLQANAEILCRLDHNRFL